MRDISQDQIFLKKFFAEDLYFFTQEVPETETEFKWQFHEATSDWDCIKEEINTYPLSEELLNLLLIFFDEADSYFYKLIGSSKGYKSTTYELSNQWNQLRSLALKIQGMSGASHRSQ